ncbi:Serine-arginine protein 55, partial [Caligus rogercresseyi]
MAKHQLHIDTIKSALSQFIDVLSTHIPRSRAFRDADDVVNDMDGKDFQGGRIRVEMARDPRDRRIGIVGLTVEVDLIEDAIGGTPVVVENLSSRTSWQDLKDYFRAAGDITYTNAHTPRQGEGS